MVTHGREVVVSSREGPISLSLVGSSVPTLTRFLSGAHDDFRTPGRGDPVRRPYYFRYASFGIFSSGAREYNRARGIYTGRATTFLNTRNFTVSIAGVGVASTCHNNSEHTTVVLGIHHRRRLNNNRVKLAICTC